MVDAVIDRHLRKKERIDALEAADVVAVLIWKRATLMVDVDAAGTAEVVLGDHRVELVHAQVLSALDDSDAVE